jgi:nitrate reductase gamma subunit
MTLLSAVFYIGLFLFLCGSTAKIRKYAKMPPHLRWELYPCGTVKERNEGSYLEQQEWWNKPPHRSFVAEARFMATEMFLFHRCYTNNRPIWRFTLPLHWGLYLLTGWLFIQLAGTAIFLISDVAGSLASFVDNTVFLASPLGVGGLILAGYGSIGLTIKRLLDPPLRAATSRSDFAGLFLIVVTLLCWIISWGVFDPSLTLATTYFRQLFSFEPLSDANPFMLLGSVMLSVFLGYMPFTYLAHPFAKYFIYHRVVWQDQPMAPGSEQERRIERMLREPVGWSASHVNEDASWGENVSSSRQQQGVIR